MWPDITSSLMRVYSRLQTDETLVLKGWKFGEISRLRSLGHFLFKEGWLFRGSIGIGMAAVVGVLTLGPLGRQQTDEAIVEHYRSAQSDVPRFQIREENKDRIKVRYLQPELLQTIEFETTSAE